MLKKSFAGHGPAPQKSPVLDLPMWGGAMRCQRSVKRDFFGSLLRIGNYILDSPGSTHAG